MARILIVEDDDSLGRLLATNLRYEGFDIALARDGMQALEMQSAHPADLLVLDLMLPRMDGFQVLQELRNRGDKAAVLVLTCRKREIDRLKGLSLGADDYMGKPFSILELVARIRAILRRTVASEVPAQSRSGAYLLDHLRLRATCHGRDLQLTPREFLLLAVLSHHAGSTLTREDLLEAGWEPDARPTLRTVDVHIARLRRKMDAQGEDPIVTVAGEGYRWTSPRIRIEDLPRSLPSPEEQVEGSR
jgi:DNA-binding response OmpR family regulator